MFIHHAGQFLDPDSNAKIVTSSGSKMYVDIDYEVIKRLEDRKREGIENTCQSSGNFSLDECLQSEMFRFQMSQFNCTGPLVARSNSSCPLNIVDDK